MPKSQILNPNFSVELKISSRLSFYAFRRHPGFLVFSACSPCRCCCVRCSCLHCCCCLRRRGFLVFTACSCCRCCCYPRHCCDFLCWFCYGCCCCCRCCSQVVTLVVVLLLPSFQWYCQSYSDDYYQPHFSDVFVNNNICAIWSNMVNILMNIVMIKLGDY